jgi:tripartite-type tricarboxylate transporter receptor subunit TctC
MVRTVFLLVTFVASILWAEAVELWAGNTGWPSQPIRLVAPFPAGSTADVVGRALGQKLSERLGQPVVVDNRVGGSGSLGADTIAKAMPDGHTIGILTPSIAIPPPKLPQGATFDPIIQFTAISMIARSPLVLVVTPTLRVKNVQELITLARSKPGQLNFSSAGPASIAYVAGALLASTAKIDLTHVPYKSTSQSVIDLITGRIEMQFATIAPSLASIRAGQLRALAVTGKTRVPALREVPTMAEAGVPGYEVTLWFALVGPAGLPAEVAVRLNREVNDILDTAVMKDALAAQGFASDPSSRQAVVEQIQYDVGKWMEINSRVAR